MITSQEATLESLHHSTGVLLSFGQRLLASIVVIGTLFCVFSFAILSVLRQPEAILHTQAFMFNYAEAHPTGSLPAYLAGNQAFSQAHQPKDPNWDGALAGASSGFALGQNIPFVGLVGGPVLGAILGYQMDSKI